MLRDDLIRAHRQRALSPEHPVVRGTAHSPDTFFQAREAADWLQSARGGQQKVGVLQVRLYRPFAADRFLAALPETVRTVGLLERTKDPGATGEPLHLDVVTTLAQAVAHGQRTGMPGVVGGRYGLSSKDFTPAMAKAVFDELARPEPRNGFTVRIVDDVGGTRLEVDAEFQIETDDVVRAVF